MIVVNDIKSRETGFQSDTNRVTILTHQGGVRELQLLSKEETAMAIFDEVVNLTGGGR